MSMPGLAGIMAGLSADAAGVLALGRPYFRSAGVHASGIGNVTPALPVGWQENDIFILSVNSSNEAISAPAGWTEVSASPQGTGTAVTIGAVRLAVFWRRATSSESAPTVTDTGDHTLAQITAYADCVTSGDPIDVAAGDVLAVADTPITWPSVTTTVTNTMVVNLLATSRDSTTSGMSNGNPTNASLTDPRNRFNDGSSSGTGGSLSVIDGFKAAIGASGSTTHTCTGPFTQARITLALKPRLSNLPFVVSVGTRGTDSVNPGLPAGYAANDIFLMAVETANEAISTPSGYSTVTDSPQGTGSAGVAGGVRLTLFWKRASGSESTVALADSGDHTQGWIVCVRGCVTSGDPWEASAGDVASSASTSVTFPAVTTLGTDRLILNFLAHDTDALVPQTSAWTNAALRFYLPFFDETTSSASGGGGALGIGAKDAAGSTGSSTATLLSSVTQGRITLALKAA